MKPGTIFVLAVGALAAGLLGIVAFRTEPVPVDLAEVTRGPMRVTVDVDGMTRITEIYEVAAPIQGTARRAPVREGDAVRAGKTVVAIIEPAASDPLDPRRRIQAEAEVREAEAALRLARSELRLADEELQLAQSEYDRVRELVERGVASLTRLENAERQFAVRKAARKAAASRVEMAEAGLDRARAALLDPVAGTDSPDSCCLRMTAPVDGRVLEMDVISERPVAPGTRLLSIGAPGELEIVADVLSVDAVRLEPGAPAIVERWGGPAPLKARVRSIEPSAHTKVSALGIEEQHVEVILDLVTPVERRPSLGHGFSVFLRIVKWQARDVLQAPLGAMFRHGEEWAVYVAEDGTARRRVVRIGRRNADTAEIVSGLAAGETVIAHPGERIADGTPIAERQ